MKAAHGNELSKGIFIGKRKIKEIHPDWKKYDTVKLCITILRKIKYLHDRNVILGDINPANILVVSPTEVYFVDTDSYQIEGYPCPVGTINYTAQELQRKEYSEFLRTMGNEYFAVATLLFMIMLPGKPPYALQGGSDQIENIMNMDFAYPLGERSTKKAPPGSWQYCWSHLPFIIKEAFYETFRKDEKHSKETTRYNTNDWLDKFENYLRLIENGTLYNQDSMSMELFPIRFKKHSSKTYVVCSSCGDEIDEERTEDGCCWDCVNAERDAKRAEREAENVRRNSIYSTIQCSECSKPFGITQGEKEYFEEKGLSLPKRCKSCRGVRTTSSQTSIRRTPNTHIRTTPKPAQYSTSRSRSYGGYIWLAILIIVLIVFYRTCGTSTPNISRTPTSSNRIDSVQTPAQTPVPITPTPTPTPEPILPLELQNQNITDEDLVKMIVRGDIPQNIENLNLTNNQISNLVPLLSLKNLKVLMLCENDISDISPLHHMQTLIWLSLGGNQISDITPLESLSYLPILDLSSNLITDIEPLNAIDALVILSLGDNQISDISPLQSLRNLEMLVLSSNQISDISSLQLLTNLTRLALDNNNIDDLSQLHTLKSITDLHLSNNLIYDIMPLHALISLAALDISSNQVSDISPLQELVHLELLIISDNKINDIGVNLFNVQRQELYDLPHVEIIN
jgi:serine/threonine protein kinase